MEDIHEELTRAIQAAADAEVALANALDKKESLFQRIIAGDATTGQAREDFIIRVARHNREHARQVLTEIERDLFPLLPIVVLQRDVRLSCYERHEHDRHCSRSTNILSCGASIVAHHELILHTDQIEFSTHNVLHLNGDGHKANGVMGPLRFTKDVTRDCLHLNVAPFPDHTGELLLGENEIQQWLDRRALPEEMRVAVAQHLHRLSLEHAPEMTWPHAWLQHRQRSIAEQLSNLLKRRDETISKIDAAGGAKASTDLHSHLQSTVGDIHQLLKRPAIDEIHPELVELRRTFGVTIPPAASTNP
jgi:hypothetical protein